jgi:predicted RNA binding protein YcfA (HicA-like mRNA interferase family)
MGYPPVTIPVHGNKLLKPKTQQSIMRDTGLTDADL